MLVSFVFMMWLGVSTQIAKSRGLIPHNQLKSLSIENCPRNIFNSSVSLLTPLLPNNITQEEYFCVYSLVTCSLDSLNGISLFFCRKEVEEVFVLLKISYLWYTIIGMGIVIFLGTIVSYITKKQDPPLPNENLLIGSILRCGRVSQHKDLFFVLSLIT